LAGPHRDLDPQGCLWFEGRLYLAAVRQIRPVNLRVDPPGFLVMLRRMDADFWAEVGDRVGGIALTAEPSVAFPSDRSLALTVVQRPGLPFSRFRFRPVDLFGRQDLVVSGELPRVVEKAASTIFACTSASPSSSPW
jgi:hypothetical protein